MTWKPITEANLLDEINQGWERMAPPERHLWEMIKIEQEKWQCAPWGDGGGGFWAVAILGTLVVWYNDIEEGFNCSQYTTYGEFSDYFCDQIGLAEVVRVLKGNIESGRMDIWQPGPPMAGEF